MTNPTFSFLAFVTAFVVSLWAAYKAWRRPDDFIEMMLAMYEDPGDLNRWMVKTGAMKWFYRALTTAMFVGMLYVGFKCIAAFLN